MWLDLYTLWDSEILVEFSHSNKTKIDHKTDVCSELSSFACSCSLLFAFLHFFPRYQNKWINIFATIAYETLKNK